MDVQTAIAMASTSVAAVIAIAVPWVSFRLTLRVDHKRWLREQRAQFYVDLLTEAYAEQQWLEQDVADDETRDRLRSRFSDPNPRVSRDMHLEMTIGAALAWDDVGCDATFISWERAPIRWAGYAVESGNVSKCGSARRIRV